MCSVSKASVAVLTFVGAMFLASCHSSSGSATQAASSGNSDSAPTSTQSQQQAQPQPQPVTIPAGTLIDVRLVDSLSSSSNRSGDSFKATLDQPILVNGWEAVPRGATVTGRVVGARASGHLETPAELSITLASLDLNGQAYQIVTSDYSRRAQSHTKHDAKWIAGLAGGGTLLGALIGRGKGAAIGAGVGAGAGTATAYATGKKDIYLPSETRVRFILRERVTIYVMG